MIITPSGHVSSGRESGHDLPGMAPKSFCPKPENIEGTWYSVSFGDELWSCSIERSHDAGDFLLRELKSGSEAAGQLRYVGAHFGVTLFSKKGSRDSEMRIWQSSSILVKQSKYSGAGSWSFPTTLTRDADSADFHKFREFKLLALSLLSSPPALPGEVVEFNQQACTVEHVVTTGETEHVRLRLRNGETVLASRHEYSIKDPPLPTWAYCAHGICVNPARVCGPLIPWLRVTCATNISVQCLMLLLAYEDTSYLSISAACLVCVLPKLYTEMHFCSHVHSMLHT